MSVTFDAVYVDGALRPIGPVVGLPEQVRLTVTVSEPATTASPNPFAGWVGDMPDNDAQEIMRTIEAELEQVPNDWR